jgi:peptidoglycan/LPS O-acetylase OafA/YrhL
VNKPSFMATSSARHWMSRPQGLDFRTDINGLRAYAVLVVLLYHFNIPLFSGGFLGVDVFFVISGFLMAAIVVPKLATGGFSLPDFYLARVRRIFPALSLLCLVLLGVGWFWFGPVDYYALGRQAISAVSFISNFVFRAEQGYFDAPSHGKWLLHTWSLAVEAQFYLLFPLILLAAKRYGWNALRALALIALLSFGMAVWSASDDPQFGFFLLPARMWELLAGSLLFFYAPRLPVVKYGAWLEAAGIGIILLCAFVSDAQTPWPSWRAIGPVIGSLLVLYAAQQRSWLTGNFLTSLLGKWSYSVYLWHWPVMAALYYWGLEANSDWIAAGIMAAFILGAASYYLVEQPSRRLWSRAPHAVFCYYALAAITLIGAIETGIYITRGFESRFSNKIIVGDRESFNRIPLNKGCGYSPKKGTLTPCIVGEKGEATGYVLWGDSHVGSIATALRDTVKKPIALYSHACPTIFNVEVVAKGDRNRCRDFEEKTFEQVSALPAKVPVIISNRYAVNLLGPNEGLSRKWGFVYYDLTPQDAGKDAATLYKEHLAKSVCRIAAIRPVYMLKPTPELGFDAPRVMTRRLITNPQAGDIGMPIADYYSRNAVILDALAYTAQQCPNVTLLDPTPYVCDATQCFASREGRALYIDDNHLSEYGNRLLMPLFARVFRGDIRADWKEKQRYTPTAPNKRLF